MSLFWRFLVAHLLTDFPLQNRWFLKNKGKLPVIALHSIVFLIASFIVFNDIFYKSPFIILAMVILTIAHFLTDLSKSLISKKRGTNFYLFLADQFVHIFTIWYVCSVLFYDGYNLVHLQYFRMSLAIFVLWGLPISAFLARKQFLSTEKLKQNSFFQEQYHVLKLIERAALFVAFSIGSYFWLSLIVLLGIRIYLFLIKKYTQIPYVSWIITILFALLARFIRI